jgi:hypothetical protein
MGNPLPEPQETQARRTIKILAPDVQGWIRHHFGNSLLPIFLVADHLEKGRPLNSEMIRIFNKTVEHLRSDLQFLTGDKPEPAK